MSISIVVVHAPDLHVGAHASVVDASSKAKLAHSVVCSDPQCQSVKINFQEDEQ